MATSQPWWVLGYYTKANILQSFYVQAATQPQYDGSKTFKGQVIISVNGPYPSLKAAEAFAAQTNGQKAPTNAQALGDVAGAGIPGLSGVAAIGDFFSRLSQASTWVRVGEVVLGLILLAVGVARITHAVPIATKIAKTAGAVAI